MNLELAIDPCEYPIWASGGHTQTILGSLLPSPSLKQAGKRVEIPLDDGDRLLAFFYEGTSDTVVYLFHGLSGHSGEDYMQRTAIHCLQEGHSVFLVNHRGAGEGASLSRKTYHLGVTDDAAAVFSMGRKLFKNKRHLAIGFSMSGNILLLLLSQAGKVKPDYLIAVNSPLQLETCAYKLQLGLNRLYDLRFVHHLRKIVEQKQRQGCVEPSLEIPRFGTMMDFDSLYTAPMAGFASRAEYYALCSSKGGLSKIRIPTILITAKDDPFVDWEDYLDTRFKANLHFHLENCGGHMGYITRKPTPLGSQRWMDYALVQYIRALREERLGRASEAAIANA